MAWNEPGTGARAGLIAWAIFGLCLAEAVSGFALGLERDALRDLHAATSPWLDPTMRQVSRYGGGYGAAVAATVVTCALLAARAWRPALRFAVSVSGGAWDSALKPLVERPRPHLWPGVEHPSTWSFPSGHATSSAAFVAALAVLAWPTRWRWPALVAGALAAAFVGFSRLQLGVHYPSDVLGGWALATGWVLLISGLARRIAGSPAAPPRSRASAVRAHRRPPGG